LIDLAGFNVSTNTIFAKGLHTRTVTRLLLR